MRSLFFFLLPIGVFGQLRHMPHLYQTRPHFGESWCRCWSRTNQTDTIFNQESNGVWQKGDTVVFHWYTKGDTITPKDPLRKGKVEWYYNAKLNRKPLKKLINQP